MDMLAIYLCSVREMSPVIKNHLTDICLIPFQGPLPPHHYIDELAAVLFCVSRSLHKLNPCLEMHFLAWKVYMQYSLPLLKNPHWSIFSLFGVQCTLYQLLLSVVSNGVHSYFLSFFSWLDFMNSLKARAMSYLWLYPHRVKRSSIYV